MANQPTNNSNFVVILTIVFGLAMVISLFSNNTANTTTRTPNRDSVEHRYVTERFKQEGLNRSEAQQAADAVLRFHEAQKKR